MHMINKAVHVSLPPFTHHPFLVPRLKQLTYSALQGIPAGMFFRDFGVHLEDWQSQLFLLVTGR